MPSQLVSQSPTDFWLALVSGRARIVDSGTTDTHHYLDLVTLEGVPRARALRPPRVRMLERVLLGVAPKVIALESDCATSTVAHAVGSCLRAMGLDQCPSRAPALLVLMLHARGGPAQRLSFHVECLPGQRGDRQRLSSARHEQDLSHRLSASELTVVRLLVEGKTYLDIARHRGSSVRTVANQIGSAYRKLGVSGRIGLIGHVAASAATKLEPRAA